MPLKFFIKDQAMVPVFDSKTGKPIPFEALAGGWGVNFFDTTNAEHTTILEALNTFASTRTGGIQEVNRDTYFEFKKKGPLQARVSPLDEPVRVAPAKFNPNKKGELAAEAVNPVKNAIHLAPNTLSNPQPQPTPQPATASTLRGAVDAPALPVSPGQIALAAALAKQTAAEAPATNASVSAATPLPPASRVTNFKPKVGKAKPKAVKAAAAVPVAPVGEPVAA